MPDRPGNDPVCVDQTMMKWMMAIMAKPGDGRPAKASHARERQ
jgi:hypothetical protein